MEPVVVGCPEVKPQSELGGQELPERDIGEAKVFRHHCHLGMTFPAGREQLPRLVPHLIGTHPMTIELVGDPLDRDLNLRYFRVIKGLRVASEGLLRGNVLKEHQDPLHAARGHVEVDIPEGVALVSVYFAVAQYPVLEDREAAVVLIGDHAG